MCTCEVVHCVGYLSMSTMMEDGRCVSRYLMCRPKFNHQVEVDGSFWIRPADGVVSTYYAPARPPPLEAEPHFTHPVWWSTTGDLRG